MTRLCRLPLLNLRSFVTKAEVINGDASKQVASAIASEVSDAGRRLFAVVYLNGRQWKVSHGDLVQLQGNLPLNVGDKIKLDKVLMVGGSSFSVFGRPLLDSSAVTVNATVVEKNTKYPELKYFHNNHEQSKSLHWLTEETTILRINDVIAKPNVAGSQ